MLKHDSSVFPSYSVLPLRCIMHLTIAHLRLEVGLDLPFDAISTSSTLSLYCIEMLQLRNTDICLCHWTMSMSCPFFAQSDSGKEHLLCVRTFKV